MFLRFFLVTTLVLIIGFFQGCTEKPRECTPKKSVTVAISSQPTSLDWPASHESSWVNYPVLLAVMNGLTTLDNKLQPAPLLAESWEVALTKDRQPKQVYTFHLRKDIVWSDGKTPLTAKDFVFGWKRAIMGAGSVDFMDVQGFDELRKARESKANPDEKNKLVKQALDRIGIEALDDYTFRVTLKGPRSYFLSRIAFTYPFFPAPSSDLEGKSEQEIQTYFNEPGNGKPMVLGPFQVSKWDRVAQKVELVVNPHSRFAPATGRVEKLSLIQADLSPLMYKQCDVDFLLMDDPSWMSSAPADTRSTNLLSVYYLSFNTTKVPLKLRQAISKAIDRDSLFSPIKSQLPGLRIADAYLPPEMPGSLPGNHPIRAKLPKFSPDEAKKLIAESGYRGEELTLLVRGSSTFMPEVAIADGIRLQLEAAGIKARIMSTANFTNDVKDADGTIRPHMFLKRTGADYAHPQTLLTPFLMDGNHYTDWQKIGGGAAIKEFENLLAMGAASTDISQATDVFGRVQELIQIKQAIVVPLFYPKRYYRKRDWIEGLEVDPLNFLTLRNMRLVEPKDGAKK